MKVAFICSPILSLTHAQRLNGGVWSERASVDTTQSPSRRHTCGYFKVPCSRVGFSPLVTEPREASSFGAVHFVVLALQRRQRHCCQGMRPLPQSPGYRDLNPLTGGFLELESGCSFPMFPSQSRRRSPSFLLAEAWELGVPTRLLVEPSKR